MPVDGVYCGSDILEKMRLEFNKLQADVMALKDKYNAAVTLINELKADHNAHLGAASMHYNGTAGVTDTTNTTAAANATTASVTADTVNKIN